MLHDELRAALEDSNFYLTQLNQDLKSSTPQGQATMHQSQSYVSSYLNK